MEVLVNKIKGYLSLFLTMLKIGLFTFGGGYAMIALLENEFVEKKKWLEKDEFLDVAAIAESTPGPIAINAATYIGYKNTGMIGSMIATLGICIPSFVIIYAISLFLDAFLSLTLVAYAFKGIQICVVYLILTAGLKMLKQMKKTAFNIIIISITLICMIVFSLFAVKFSTIFYILLSGACGVAVYLLGKIRKEKKQ
ncbi:MAG: chromate transporter [Oscillospiraceae bacterium]|nr:chromate transporter [Oscillospiraceae bacterium]